MISVLMSVYKEPEEYLRKSIESILNQTESDFEYIIVLDNPENTMAKYILEEYAAKDSRIKIIYNRANIGLTASLNVALNAAAGTYIARMDADDISEVTRLEKQLKYLLDHDLDMVGCSLRRISESGEIVNQLTNPSYPAECIAQLLKYDDCVPHPSWFVKRNVYEQLSGYREIHSCEDYDFLLRAVKQNVKIGICDIILLNYRINTKGISRSNSLKQMLSSHYLQKNFDRLDDVTQKEIDSYLERKITPKKAARYEQAVQALNRIIDSVKNGRKSEIFKVPLLFFRSPYIGINIVKIIRMMTIKKKYK